MYSFGKIEHDVMKFMPLLIQRLQQDDDVIALYLFGSYAGGQQTPFSDVDLAVLLDQTFPKKLYFKKKLDLLVTVTSILKTDAVDLVVLNEAPPALSYQVLKKGKLLLEKPETKAQRVNFQVCVLDRYFDFQPVEHLMRQGLIRRLKEGTFGG